MDIAAPPCAAHPGLPSEFFCNSCRAHYCAECVTHLERGKVDQCVHCQAVVRPNNDAYTRATRPNDFYQAVAPAPGAAAFIHRLTDMLSYPLQQSVVLNLFALSIFTAALGWAVAYNISGILGLLGALFILMLEATTYFHIVRRTAVCERELNPPDITDVFDDFVAPGIRYLAVSLPIIIAACWYGDIRFDSWLVGISVFADITVILDYPGPAILMVAGVVLLPLLTAIAAISESFSAMFNPVVWYQSLRLLGDTYLAAVVVFYAVLAFQLFVWIKILVAIQLNIEIPIVTTVAVQLLSYFPMALRGAVIGGMCAPYMNGPRDD